MPVLRVRPGYISTGATKTIGKTITPVKYVDFSRQPAGATHIYAPVNPGDCGKGLLCHKR